MGFFKNSKYEIVLVAEIHIVVETEAVRGFPTLETFCAFFSDGRVKIDERAL